jgi:hypothetical protein
MDSNLISTGGIALVGIIFLIVFVCLSVELWKLFRGPVPGQYVRSGGHAGK